MKLRKSGNRYLGCFFFGKHNFQAYTLPEKVDYLAEQTILGGHSPEGTSNERSDFMRNSLLLPVLFLLMMGQQAKAALVFSVASGSLVAGATSFDAEIRVSGGALDSLQYFAIETSASTLSGGKTLNIASQSTLNSLTLRNSADYVLFDRGQSVTGAGSATFVSNVGTSSAEFRDGVSVPNILGPGGAILNSPVVPGSGRLVAKLQFTLASGTFEAGDSFSINLAKLASNTNQFSVLVEGNRLLLPGLQLITLVLEPVWT